VIVGRSFVEIPKSVPTGNARAASDHIGHESIQADACKQHRKRSSNLRHKMKINERLVQEPGALYSKCIRLVRGRRHRGRGQRRWR